MKGKRKKEEGISSETRRKKAAKTNRLSSMIESMQKRGSPVSAHKVATKYFDSFRKERNIPSDAAGEGLSESGDTAVDTGADNAVITAVDSAVMKKPRGKRASRKTAGETAGVEDLDATLGPSELKVYWAMYSTCSDKKSDTLRFGLKELRELTGLSDKTVRVSIHLLEDKLCIKVVEPSQGIYGRKFRVLTPEEAFEERAKSGMEIDTATKKIIKPAAPVTTAVSTAVNNAVATAVDTAVYVGGRNASNKRQKVESLYKRYTGNKWTQEDDLSYEKIAGFDESVIETAIILSVLKGEGGKGSIAVIEPVLKDLAHAVPDSYLEQLRELWKSAKMTEHAGKRNKA